MTDRELLELAAKAANLTGYIYEWINGPTFIVSANPDAPRSEPRTYDWLNDDGDALRLAVELRINVEPWGSGAAAIAYVRSRATVAEPHYGDDPARAVRRAIVRAAAEIGKSL